MQVNSRKLFFRSAQLKDSEFIFNLRSKKGDFINNVGFTKASNEKWMKGCVSREREGLEFYFIIYDKNEQVGVVRVYKINNQEKTFTWGSWILKDESSPLYPIISAVMIYSFAFDFLGMTECFFDVRNDNTKVKSFHKKTGAIFLRKNDVDSFYCFKKVSFVRLLEKYKKYIGEIYFKN